MYWFAVINGNLVYGSGNIIRGLARSGSLIGELLKLAEVNYTPPTLYNRHQKTVSFDNFIHPFITAVAVRDIAINSNHVFKGFDSAKTAKKILFSGNNENPEVQVVNIYNSIIASNLAVDAYGQKRSNSQITQDIFATFKSKKLLQFPDDKNELTKQYFQDKLPVMFLHKLLEYQKNNDSKIAYLRRGTKPTISKVDMVDLARIRRVV